MRTLKEMKTELSQIDNNLETLSVIASLARPFNSFDLTTWNTIIPSTAEHIESLSESIAEAIDSMSVYTRELAFKIRSRSIDAQEAITEYQRVVIVSESLNNLAEDLETQTVKFNTYQEQVLKRTSN